VRCADITHVVRGAVERDEQDIRVANMARQAHHAADEDVCGWLHPLDGNRARRVIATRCARRFRRFGRTLRRPRRTYPEGDERGGFIRLDPSTSAYAINEVLRTLTDKTLLIVIVVIFLFIG